MICTFGDITDVDVVARAGAAGARGHPAQRHVPPRDVGRARAGSRSTPARAQQAYDQLAGLSAAKARAEDRRAAARERRPARRAAADHARGEVLREGRPPARDRHEPAVVHQDDGVARGAARARPRAAVASAVHAGAVRELGRTASNGDWCVSRQRFFGVPFPVWYPRARGRHRRLRARSCRPRSACRSTRRPTCPTGYTRRPARSARRLHRRPGHHGHVGDLVAHAADRRRLDRGSGPVRARVPDGPAAAGARHHPHVALLDGAARRTRARLAAVDERGDLGLGARSRSQEDVEVEGQRRHADGAARGARVGRRALLGGERPSRRRHGVRPGPDARRPPARDQAAQRVEVRRWRKPGPRGPVTSPSIAAC